MQIDRDLISACISQKREAQKQLYKLLLPYLRAIAYRYLRDTSYLKDALQESYVKIFNELKNYNFDKGTLKHWAARITINTCINYNKRVIGIPNTEFLIDQHEEIALPEVLEKISNENFLFILKQMPEGYFDVFNLFIIDGYAHDEIASILGISVELSRKRLSRARKWLKKTFIGKIHLIEQISSSSTYLN